RVVHLEERLVAKDARVVHEDIELAEGVDRGLDDVLGAGALGDVVEARDRLAAGGPDLRADLLGHRLAFTGDAAGTAEVVDDALGALLGEENRVRAADSTAGAGDRTNLSAEKSHPLPPSGAAQ